MKKLLKKLLAPLIREVVAEELKEVRFNLKILLLREAVRQVFSEKKEGLNNSTNSLYILFT